MKTVLANRIGLLFNGHRTIDRAILGGIADYLRSTRVAWESLLDDNLHARLGAAARWDCNGIIADVDDPDMLATLEQAGIPFVGVGGSFANVADYPAAIPYVATDHAALVDLACRHLIEGGMQRLAMYSQPEAARRRCAGERELAFAKRMLRDGQPLHLHHGGGTVDGWRADGEALAGWLHGLPKPIGIVCADDTGAHKVLQCCLREAIAVPTQVAVVGIGNDPVVQMFGRIPLSSVMPDGHAVGHSAARMLHQLMAGAPLAQRRVVIGPAGINVAASSRRTGALPPAVMQARYFIRQHACRGIKVQQVADYVGISRTSLDQSFKAHTGRTVHEEIVHSKLEAAKGMLAGRPASLAEVARQCGFSSVQYMYTVFRRELGCSPRAFRERGPGANAVRTPFSRLAPRVGNPMHGPYWHIPAAV